MLEQNISNGVQLSSKVEKALVTLPILQFSEIGGRGPKCRSHLDALDA